jgi:hypothetical protein
MESFEAAGKIGNPAGRQLVENPSHLGNFFKPALKNVFRVHRFEPECEFTMRLLVGSNGRTGRLNKRIPEQIDALRRLAQ